MRMEGQAMNCCAKRCAAVTALLAGLLGFAATVTAADWSATSVWFLSGDDFELGERERTITRLEHADSWKYGDNYFFVDFTQSAESTTSYAEYEPRLSLGKISGRELRYGPVKDVLLTGAYNVGEDFRTYLYGMAADLELPGFAWFRFAAYGRDDDNLPGQSWQLTPAWLYPIQLGRLSFSFQGFVDYIGAEGPSARNLVVVPRLWWDVGALWGAPGHVQVGVEYFYWKNKFGVEGVDEEVLQPAIRLTF